MKIKEKYNKTKNISIITVTILIILILVSAYLIGTTLLRNASTSTEAKVSNFKNRTEFLKLLKRNENNMTLESSDLSINEGTFENAKTIETSDDYSDTNIQVTGVDESDNVKTDGEYIYTISDNNVIIFKTLPVKNSNVYKKIEYTNDENNNFSPNSFYIDDNYLVVIGNKYSYNNYPLNEKKIYIEENFNYFPSNSEKIIYIYDKNNEFEQIKKLSFEGDLVTSRKIDNNIFLIINKSNYYNEELKDEEILPYYSIDDNKIYLNYTDITYHDDTIFNSTNIIYGIDLNNLDNISYSATVGNSTDVYMSKNNIYLVEQEYKYLNPFIDMFIDFENSNSSIITKYNLNGNKSNYIASKKVPGTIINQFSMDEYNNNFRIATTERTSSYKVNENGENIWTTQTNNRLYILDSNLNEISKLENLGKEEETFTSCRFEQDKAYLVTFLKTDPLYVIDLSNVNIPTITSELEITGYSTYQHPYDEDHIIGIGFEANENGETIGMKISLFDVSNKGNAQEIFKEVMLYEDYGWSYSSATYNHKDLLFDKDKNILAFPLSIYNNSNGYMVYNIDLENGITKNGFVTHKNAENIEFNYNNNSAIKKGIYINNYLYTISNNFIVISPLSNVENYTKEISLK